MALEDMKTELFGDYFASTEGFESYERIWIHLCVLIYESITM